MKRAREVLYRIRLLQRRATAVTITECTGQEWASYDNHADTAALWHWHQQRNHPHHLQ